jgi:hypothetical protein
MCEHLIALDRALLARGLDRFVVRPASADGNNEWVYYNCLFNMPRVRANYELPQCVKVLLLEDMKAGMTRGFHCILCECAVTGRHPVMSKGAVIFE